MKNKAQLPADFARTLRDLYTSRDPRLGPTIKAAQAKGWAYALLGSALELTAVRARQIGLKETGHEPVNVPEPAPGAPGDIIDKPRLSPEQIDLLRSLRDDAFSLESGSKRADRLRAEEELDDALAEQWLRGVSFQDLADELNFSDPSPVQRRVFQAQARNVEAATTISKATIRERERERRDEEIAYKNYFDALLAVRTSTLRTKNLRALEDLPGVDGELWRVQCKFCNRVWRMPSDKLRACPHKGAGDGGMPPAPRPAPAKRSPATPPPPVEEMTLHVAGRPAQPADLPRRYALLFRARNGQWAVAVQSSQHPHDDYYDDMLRSPLAYFASYLGVGDDAPVEEAVQQLGATGWAVTDTTWHADPLTKWGAMQLLTAQVTSPLVTEYVIGREILGSEGQAPHLLARNHLKRRRIRPVGMCHDSKGKKWRVYYRAECANAR